MNNYLDNCLKKHGHKVFGRWNAPKNSIYIGRGSIFGNPFPLYDEKDRIQVLLTYKDYLDNKIKSELFKQKLLEIKDKNLECYCSNGTSNLNDGAKYCHGHVLLEYANNIE